MNIKLDAQAMKFSDAPRPNQIEMNLSCKDARDVKSMGSYAQRSTAEKSEFQRRYEDVAHVNREAAKERPESAHYNEEAARAPQPCRNTEPVHEIREERSPAAQESTDADQTARVEKVAGETAIADETQAGEEINDVDRANPADCTEPADEAAVADGTELANETIAADGTDVVDIAEAADGFEAAGEAQVADAIPAMIGQQAVSEIIGAEEAKVVDRPEAGNDENVPVEGETAETTSAETPIDSTPALEIEQLVSMMLAEVFSSSTGVPPTGESEGDAQTDATPESGVEVDSTVTPDVTAHTVVQADIPAELVNAAGAGTEEVAEAGNAGSVEQVPPEVKQALQVIKESLVTISDTLRLNMAADLENIDIKNVSEAVVGELAEIIYSLKNVSAVLEQAMEKGMPLQIRGQTLESAQLPQMERTIRVELFRIELAIETIGISREVQSKVAEKGNLSIGAGVAQALDPAVRPVSLQQVRQVFGEALGIAQDMETSIRKLVELVRDQNAAVTAPQRQTIVIQDTRSTMVQNAMANVGYFDTFVLRKLLKIDTADVVVKENVFAAQQNEKLGIPKMFDVSLARGAQDLLLKLKEMPTSVMPVTATTAGAKAEMLLINLESKITQMPLKTLEESVMMQVTQRFQEVLRSGLTEIKLTLKPESLGEVRIRIQMQGDIVSARIHVENQQVKHIVETNFQSLKNALAEHNLQTGDFQVNIGGGNAQDAWDAAQEALKEQEKQQKQDNSSGTEPAEDLKERVIANGMDTGRRYGDNTVEYYA